MNRVIFNFAAGVAFFGLHPLASAALIDNGEQPISVGAVDFQGAQSFRAVASTPPGVAQNIAGGSFFVTPLGGPPPVASQNLRVSLYDEAMLSGGAAIASATVSYSSAGWVDAFWAPIAVTVGKMYYLRAEQLTATPGTGWYLGGGAPYLSGDGISGSGITWFTFGGAPIVYDVANPTSGDFAFRTFSDPTSVTAVPEPSTYALMFVGLGVVGFMARRKRRAPTCAAT
jgi:hypothetical protein